MNKFEIGEWVHIKTAGLNGKITNILISNCYPEKYIYTIDICIGGVVHLSGDIPEFDLQPFDEIDCRGCCGCGVCEDSDYKNNKEAESLDNDKKFNLGDLCCVHPLPQIVDYIYNEEKATTVLKWSDGTTTKATVQMGDEPDKLTGFAYAVAKKYYGGNDFFAEADYWLIRKPRKEKALIKKLKQDAENERKREEKRKRNRERRVLRAKALDRKREYEARKFAAEKYGVPMEWNEDNA